MTSLAMDIYNYDALLVDLQTFIYNIIGSIDMIFLLRICKKIHKCFRKIFFFATPEKRHAH